nr:cytochrome C oxidase subunit 3 [Ipomoea batatas]
MLYSRGRKNDHHAILGEGKTLAGKEKPYPYSPFIRRRSSCYTRGEGGKTLPLFPLHPEALIMLYSRRGRKNEQFTLLIMLYSRGRKNEKNEQFTLLIMGKNEKNEQFTLLIMLYSRGRKNEQFTHHAILAGKEKRAVYAAHHAILAGKEKRAVYALVATVSSLALHFDMSFNNLTNSISRMRIEVCDSLSFLDLSENRFTDSVLSWWRLGTVLVSPR